jgi:hypothetical protein
MDALIGRVPGGWREMAIILVMSVVGFLATTWLVERFAR